MHWLELLEIPHEDEEGGSGQLVHGDFQLFPRFGVDLRGLIEDDQVEVTQPSRRDVLLVCLPRDFEGRVYSLNDNSLAWWQAFSVHVDEGSDRARDEDIGSTGSCCRGSIDDDFGFASAWASCHKQTPTYPRDIGIDDLTSGCDYVEDTLLFW